MKVCHITSAHPDKDVRIFYKECTSLVKAGFDVSLVIPNAKSRIENGVNIIGVESKYSSRKERMTKTVDDVVFTALKVDAEIYHIHDPELLKKVKHIKKLGKKVIYDAHEDLPRQILSKTWIAKPVRKIISIVTEKYENHIAKKCNAIVAATPFIRDRFLKLNPHTIDVNNYPILDELLSDYNYEGKVENSICYVGGITKTRGLIELVKSLGSTDVKLVLAGSVEQNFQEELKKLDSWKSVDYRGFLNRNEIKNLYKNSKIGMVTLHPIINYIDSLPIKMFEYMAAGLPVIASNFPLWKSIVEDNNCGICVNPLNPNEIGNAINKILQEPTLAKEMGLNGKKLVKGKYNWKNEELKLVELYKKLN